MEVLCTNATLVDLGANLVLFITLIILVVQASLMRQANRATSYKVAFDILQDQGIRDARRHVLRKLKYKHYEEWSEEDKEQAEKVCYTFDAVGQMVNRGLLPKEWIISNWLVGLKQSWEILKPLVYTYRAEREFPDNWDDYESLADEAGKY